MRNSSLAESPSTTLSSTGLESWLDAAATAAPSPIEAMAGFLATTAPPSGARALALLRERYPEAALADRLEACALYARSLL
ncbi:MAG: hypothetical protein HXY25_08725 [Alphaproteobacteria bacterium]|nr:hypothetical protein [Alphaproteobacteria bacterium]